MFMIFKVVNNMYLKKYSGSFFKFLILLTYLFNYWPVLFQNQLFMRFVEPFIYLFDFFLIFNYLLETERKPDREGR